MEKKDEFMGQFQIPTVGIDGEEIDEDEDRPTIVNGGLAEKYADMMENAEEAWIEILKIPIIESTGYLDYLQIMNYSITADFVISANLYVTIGMTFEHSVANRYNFSVKLFERRATNNTINLEENHYQFDFYVMGTMGFRAGVEFELAVGVFTTKLDSVGIEAEAGVYAQLWGYFYFSLGWSESGGKESEYSGALAIEVGMYLEIKFKAQAFSSEKLTYDPTIYENEFPFLTIGSVENVYDFAYEEDDEILNMEAKSTRAISVPELLFSMNYMDMKSGEIYGSDGEDDEHLKPISYIDSEDEHFDIEFSNRAFRYDAENNKIIVSPFDEFSIEENTTMTITWKKAPLAFSSKSLQRVANINWTEVYGIRTYDFYTENGTVVEPISAMLGAPIEWPEDPVRVGYIFKGWKEQVINWKGGGVTYWPGYYTCPENGRMPDDFRGYTYRILVADWEARNDVEYKVEIYRSVSKENPDGTYSSAMELYETKTYNDGTSDQIKTLSTRDAGVYDSAYEAYDLDYPSFYNEQEKVIAPDGSTVFKFYYYLKPVYVSFHIGGYNGKDFDNGTSASTKTYKRNYGEPVIVPKMAYDGYVFLGFNGGTIKPGDEYRLTSIGKHEQLWGEWVPSNDTPYRVIHYVEDKENWGRYLPTRIDLKKGTTDTKATYNESDLLKLDGYYLDTEHPDSILKTTVNADGSGTLELYYTRKKYTLTFDFNGAKVTGGENMHKLDENNQVVVGHYDLAPNIIPQAKGYVFDGWFVKNGKDTNDWGYQYLLDIRPVNGDVELYARWINADYAINIVHYRQNLDGTYDIPVFETEQITRDQDGNLFETGSVVDVSKFVDNYVRKYEGYTFNSMKYGFATSVNDTVFEKLYTIPEDFAEKDLAIVLLYERNKFYFDGFNLNGGSVVSEGSPMGYYRYEQEFKAPVVKREGYEFKGWSTELSGGAAVDVITTVPATGIPRYHAIWEPVANTPYTFNAYFADENGEYDATPSRTETFTGVTDSVVKPTDFADRYLDELGGYEVDVKKSTPHLPWTIKADGSLVVNVFYKRTEKTITYMVDGVEYHKISAVWNSEIDAGKLPSKEPTKEGYNFAFWGDAETNGSPVNYRLMPTKDVVVYANWQIKQYSISWNLNGGTIDTTKPYTANGKYDYGTVIVAPTVKKTGWSFAGWDKAVADKLCENQTYTATWKPRTVVVNYYPNVPEGYEEYLSGTMNSHEITSDNRKTADNTFELLGTVYVASHWVMKDTNAVYGFGEEIKDVHMDGFDEINLYMHWIKRITTDYKLEVYLQDVRGNWNAKPYWEYSGIVSVDKEVTLSDWENLGVVNSNYFTLDMNNENNNLTGKVDPSGRSVFKAYYTRNKFSVTWIDGDANTLKTDEHYYETKNLTYQGATPTQSTDEKYSYTFNNTWYIQGTGTKLTDDYVLSGNVTMVPQFDKTPNTYTIVFHGNGGTVRGDVDHIITTQYGKYIEIPSAVTTLRESDEEHNYTFSHWTSNPDGTGTTLTTLGYYPTGNDNWYAQWIKEVKTYNVWWKDYDNYSNLEHDTAVAHGTIPVYNGRTPEKPGNAQYTYEFTGWSPEVGPITCDTTYLPQFKAVEKELTVIYYDHNSNIIEQKQELYSVATDPSKHTQAPAVGKPSTEKYTYEFRGYRQDISEINNGIVKYYAEYDQAYAKYTVTWLNHDGTVLTVDEFEYGAMPKYTGETPVKEPSNPNNECEFVGWTPELTEVTGNTSYTATFIEAAALVDITWVMSGRDWHATAPGYTGNGENWVVKYEIGEPIVPPQLEYNLLYTKSDQDCVHIGWDANKAANTPITEWGVAEENAVYYPIWETTDTLLYPLFVNGVRINSENMSDVLGDGTVSFTYNSTNGRNYLKFNNFTYDPSLGTTTVIRPATGEKFTAAVIIGDDYHQTRIELVGDNYINVDKVAENGETVCGIYSEANINLDGSGSFFDVKGTDYGLYTNMKGSASWISNRCGTSYLKFSGNKAAVSIDLDSAYGDKLLGYDTFDPTADTDGFDYFKKFAEAEKVYKHIEHIHYEYYIYWHYSSASYDYAMLDYLPGQDIIPTSELKEYGKFFDKKPIGWIDPEDETRLITEFGKAELSLNGTENHYYPVFDENE